MLCFYTPPEENVCLLLFYIPNFSVLLIGLIGPAICLLGVTVSGCRPELIVALFCLAMALNGFVYSGFNVTHVDMSPAFAGTMYAITNTVANFCGVIGPGIVGAFTDSGVSV